MLCFFPVLLIPLFLFPRCSACSHRFSLHADVVLLKKSVYLFSPPARTPLAIAVQIMDVDTLPSETEVGVMLHCSNGYDARLNSHQYERLTWCQNQKECS